MVYVVVALGLAALVVGHEVILRRARRRFRAGIAFAIAGTASYLALSAIAFAFLCLHGQWTGRAFWVVDEAMPGMPADGKLEAGDRILAVDAVPIHIRESLVERVNRGGGKPVVITYERAGGRREVTIQPALNTDTWQLGIKPTIDRERVIAPARAIVPALTYPLHELVEVVRRARLVFQQEGADPGGPKAIYDVYEPPDSGATVATQGLLLLAAIALAVQLVVDVIRMTRASPGTDGRGT